MPDETWTRRHASRSAYDYLDQYGPGRAVTKAEHDRRVAETGRPYTETGERHKRTTNSRQRATLEGAPIVNTETAR